ncbi:MAG: Hsp20/alpha crystallin family protein [Pseudomonadota bacterium]
MDVTKWRPFRELENLRGEMDRVWDRFFGEGTPLGKRGGGWVPPIDISETKDSIVITAELPGVDPQDVSVSLVEDTLTIKGEKKQEKEEKEENYYRVERTYGSFSRSLRVPVSVKRDGITAQHKNGVLRISLPIAEEVKSKEIQIKVE